VRLTHPQLNAKNDAIRQDFESRFGAYNYELAAKKPAKLGIVAGGVSFAIVQDLLASWGREDVAVLKIGTPVPLPEKMVMDFISRHDNVLILEETYPVIENQLPDRTKVKGRHNGFVPRAGELLPEIIEELVLKALGEPGVPGASPELKAALEELQIKPKPPMLCPGCPHRASFFAIRKAVPNGIYPSDIGCYTLGVNQRMVDSVICMGASVTQPSGFYLAHRVDGKEQPLVSTIGDSTFFHMGIPGLVNAVYNRHAFVLAILDNSITAMTGGQQNPATGKRLRGEPSARLDLETVCRACGVKSVRVVDPHDLKGLESILREEMARPEVSVVITRRPCVMIRKPTGKATAVLDPATCIGCRRCLSLGCPAISFRDGKPVINTLLCYPDCRLCADVCPKGALSKDYRREAVDAE